MQYCAVPCVLAPVFILRLPNCTVVQDMDGQVALLQGCLSDALGGAAPAYQDPSDIDAVESAFSEKLKHLEKLCQADVGAPDPDLSTLLSTCKMVSLRSRFVDCLDQKVARMRLCIQDAAFETVSLVTCKSVALYRYFCGRVTCQG